jgi:hypothetical protein
MNMDLETSVPKIADAKRVIQNEIRAKWDRISQEEISALRNSDDLALQLQAKYGLTKTYALWEVQTFLKCRAF